ncbi:hypothetical protein DY000_02031478 [Brassica cretica]|uniref:Uncharacterized protein n=1 Tax=Brassica cretica TaxID=69181 RepID=A0ABQ7DQ35_BRACR|nr:hypothetical protein DY000_02031478 [Brassica cretica]
MKWVRYGLQEIASKGKRECIDSRRIDVSEELGRYVATELGSSSIATDRAWLVRGLIAILELVRGWFRYVSVALGQPVFDSIET